MTSRIKFASKKFLNKFKKSIFNNEKKIKYEGLSEGSFAGYSRGLFSYTGSKQDKLITEEAALKEFSIALNKYQKDSNNFEEHYEQIKKSTFISFFDRRKMEQYEAEGRKEDLEEAKARFYGLKPLPISVIFKILTKNGLRYITVPIKSVLNNFQELVDTFRKGEFLRKDLTGSDALEAEDIIVLDNFAIVFKTLVLKDKKKHVSQFFKLKPLPKDYDKKKNDCLRCVLTEMFTKTGKTEYLDKNGKFKTKIIDRLKYDSNFLISILYKDMVTRVTKYDNMKRKYKKEKTWVKINNGWAKRIFSDSKMHKCFKQIGDFEYSKLKFEIEHDMEVNNYTLDMIKAEDCAKLVEKYFFELKERIKNEENYDQSKLERKTSFLDKNLGLFLELNNISFKYVDDYITRQCATISEVETLPYFCPQTRKTFKIEVSKHSFDLSKYDFLLFINKNHIALTETKKIEFYVDSLGDFLIFNEEKKTLVQIDINKIFKGIKERKDIPKIDSTNHYLNKANLKDIRTQTEYIKRYIFFDFEGIIDFKNKHITTPYSVSYYILHEYSKAKSNSYEFGDSIFDCETTLMTAISKKRKYDHTNKNMEIIEPCENERKTQTTPAGGNNVPIIYHGFELSYDCAKKLAEIVMKPLHKNTITYLISFNGQGYDNFILYNAIKELTTDPEKLSTPFYSGSKMLNFSYNKSTKCFDLYRFTSNSLAKVCESFKLDLPKLNLNHSTTQYLYEQSPETLMTELKKMESLEEYNNRDVEVLLLLSCKLNLAFSAIFGKIEKIKLEKGMKIEKKDDRERVEIESPFDKSRKSSIFEYMTLPGLVMDIFRKYINKKVNGKCLIKQPKTIYQSCKGNIEKTEQYYDLFMQHKTGGRVQLFGEKPIKSFECASPDIKSSYPNVMLTGEYYYPVGNFKEIPEDEIDEFVEEEQKGIFFIVCDVDESNLKFKMLCKKVNMLNQWEHDGLHEQVLISDFQYREFIKRKCTISNITKCIYYKNKILGTELFKPMVGFMSLKGEQDILQKKKDPNYNPALREMAKLCLNSLSGKFIERLHLNSFYELTEIDYLKMEINGIVSESSVIEMNGQKAIMDITHNKISNLSRMSCVQIGFLIYVYSKHYLYERIEKMDPFYCDTDSIKCRQSLFDKWKEETKNELIPHNEEIVKYMPEYKHDKLVDGKMFGSWENEYTETKVNYFLDKKMYLSVFKDGRYKMTFKGVGKKAIPIILKKIVNKKLKEISIYVDTKRLQFLEQNKTVSESELTDDKIVSSGNYVLHTFKIDELSINQLNQLYAIGKPLHMMVEEVFETLYVDGAMSFITTSLRRSIKNNKKHRNFSDGKNSDTFNDILLGVSIKHIKINNHDKQPKRNTTTKQQLSQEEEKELKIEEELFKHIRKNQLNITTEDTINTSIKIMNIPREKLLYSKTSIYGSKTIQVFRVDNIYVEGDKCFIRSDFPLHKFTKKKDISTLFYYNMKATEAKLRKEKNKDKKEEIKKHFEASIIDKAIKQINFEDVTKLENFGEYNSLIQSIQERNCEHLLETICQEKKLLVDLFSTRKEKQHEEDIDMDIEYSEEEMIMNNNDPDYECEEDIAICYEAEPEDIYCDCEIDEEHETEEDVFLFYNAEPEDIYYDCEIDEEHESEEDISTCYEAEPEDIYCDYEVEPDYESEEDISTCYEAEPKDIYCEVDIDPDYDSEEDISTCYEAEPEDIYCDCEIDREVTEEMLFDITDTYDIYYEDIYPDRKQEDEIFFDDEVIFD